MSLVIDSSVALAWIYPEETTDAVRQVLADGRLRSGDGVDEADLHLCAAGGWKKEQEKSGNESETSLESHGRPPRSCWGLGASNL